MLKKKKNRNEDLIEFFYNVELGEAFLAMALRPEATRRKMG